MISSRLIIILLTDPSEKDEVFGVLLITTQGTPFLLSHLQFFKFSAYRFDISNIKNIVHIYTDGACKGNPGAVMVIGVIISQEALSLTLISYVPAPNPENDVS